MNQPANQKMVLQTVGRAAIKTFLQAGVGAAGTLLLGWILTNTTSLGSGGDVRDIDFTPLVSIAGIFVLMGISALTSLAMNWGKTPTPPPVVINEPVVEG